MRLSSVHKVSCVAGVFLWTLDLGPWRAVSDTPIRWILFEITKLLSSANLAVAFASLSSSPLLTFQEAIFMPYLMRMLPCMECMILLCCFLDPRRKGLVPLNTPTGYLQVVKSSYTLFDWVSKEVMLMVKMDPRSEDLIQPLAPTTT